MDKLQRGDIRLLYNTHSTYVVLQELIYQTDAHTHDVWSCKEVSKQEDNDSLIYITAKILEETTKLDRLSKLILLGMVE